MKKELFKRFFIFAFLLLTASRMAHSAGVAYDSFGFRGNTVLSRSDLLGIIDEQKVLGVTKDFAELARKRIEEKYQLMGYAGVAIQIQTFERRDGQHVTFHITEGKRFRISFVDFDGNVDFVQEDLERTFFENASGLIAKRYFSEKEIEKSAQSLIEWMKAQGYLSAKYLTIRYELNLEKSTAKIIIYLYEGEQTIIQSIAFEGASSFSRAELLALLDLNESQPLNIFKFNERIEAIRKAYKSRAYYSMKFTNEGQESVVTYLSKNHFAEIRLIIDEGPQYRLSHFTIEGLENTKEIVVRREVQFKEGEVLEEELVADTESRIRKLGIFSQVTLQMRDDPDQPGYKQVRILIQEGTPGIISGGVGLRNDLGVRFFGEFGYANLWNRNHMWTISGSMNRRFEFYKFVEYQVRLSYLWPYFLFKELMFRPELINERKQFVQFSADTTQFTSTWERNIYRKINLIIGFTYSLETTRQFNAASLVDNQRLSIGAIIPNFRIDKRDSTLAPTKGFFVNGSFEIASPSFGSQTAPFPVGYQRFQSRTDFHHTFPIGWLLFLSFRTGTIRNTIDPYTANGQRDERIGVPLVKQFALGGINSLRGYRFQELNVQQLNGANYQIVGTSTYMNYRAQLDFPISKQLSMGPFVDAANLLVDEFSFVKNVRVSTGAGLHYQTPVGPVNFDWGVKVDPQPNEDPSLFHFSIGVI